MKSLNGGTIPANVLFRLARWQTDGEMPDAHRSLSPRAAIALGVVVAAAGIAIIAVALLANAEGFHAPRWVVASVGGAFLFFGGWTAYCSASGYDPKRPETLPGPLLQLVVGLPGLVLFALPFHWVAFGSGPRQFSGGLSFLFFSLRSHGAETAGRIAFGIGAALIDVIIVAFLVKLARRAR